MSGGRQQASASIYLQTSGMLICWHVDLLAEAGLVSTSVNTLLH